MVHLIHIAVLLIALKFSMAELNAARACNIVFTNSRAKENYNRKLVFAFYQEAFGDLKIEAAADKYLAPDYIQHNPNLADGRQAFIDFDTKGSQGATKNKVDIRSSAADGDLVWLHVRNVIQGKALAIVEIYRVKCGIIVEHWGISQAIGTGPYANDHPFF